MCYVYIRDVSRVENNKVKNIMEYNINADNDVVAWYEIRLQNKRFFLPSLNSTLSFHAQMLPVRIVEMSCTPLAR